MSFKVLSWSKNFLQAFWTFGCSLMPSFYSYELLVSSDIGSIF